MRRDVVWVLVAALLIPIAVVLILGIGRARDVRNDLRGSNVVGILGGLALAAVWLKVIADYVRRRRRRSS